MHIYNCLIGEEEVSSEEQSFPFDSTHYKTIIDELLDASRKKEILHLIEPPSCKILLAKYLNIQTKSLNSEKSEFSSKPTSPHNSLANCSNFLTPFFKHCTLYVTCEPCIMCAAALSMIGLIYIYLLIIIIIIIIILIFYHYIYIYNN